MRRNFYMGRQKVVGHRYLSTVLLERGPERSDNIGLEIRSREEGS